MFTFLLGNRRQNIIYFAGLLVFFSRVGSSDIADGFNVTTDHVSFEIQRFDGWYNNFAHPEWGSVEQRIIRKAPPSYIDGVYVTSDQSKPNARVLSQTFMKGGDGVPSSRNRTTLLAFFGEFLAFDILQGTDHGCPIEMLKIEIDKCDKGFDPNCEGKKVMPVLRTKYDRHTGQSPNNPRAQTNLMTSWIDGSSIYSTKEVWTMNLRTFKDGRFKVDDKNMPHKNGIDAPLDNPHGNLTDLYLLGDPRSNQHPPILTFNILFYRYHNYWADRVKREHPDWSDEQIFQKARRMVIGVLQKIALYEYLPAFLDTPIEPYNGYNPDVHPGVADLFQAAAFRFGHTQIPAGIYMRNRKRDGHCVYPKTKDGYPAYRLCNMWFNSQQMLAEVGGIEPVLLGMSSQIAEKEDAIIIDDLRENMFGPAEFSRRDLAAVNIVRGRDYGLPDYNTARKAYKLPPITRWSDINPRTFNEDPALIDQLREFYGSVDNVDVYVGGMLECDGTKPGELFTAIIKEQFLRIRDADRFWFENKDAGILSESEIEEILNATLRDVILNATDIEVDEIQKNVFFWHEGDPCPQPKQVTGAELKPCMAMGRINSDLFSGNEVAYIYTCILVACIPLLSILSAFWLLKYRRRKRRQYKRYHLDHAFPNAYGEAASHEKVIAYEWLHSEKKRLVKIKFCSDNKIQIENRKGDRLRSINTKAVQAMMLEITADSTADPMALLRIHKDYDLVLIFPDISQRTKFIAKLTQFLENSCKELAIAPTTHEQILNTAETKEKRQKRLERFFKIAYARAFGVDKQHRSEKELKECEEVMQIKLTKSDFAEALAMKPNCAFINKMFNCIDKAGEGKLSFQQFLDLIVRFSNGDAKERLRVLFDMCDSDGTGMIDHSELFDLMRSLLDMTASQKGASGLDGITWKIFEAYGLHGKKRLCFDDFLLLFREHQDEIGRTGLDFKGVRQTFMANDDTPRSRSPSLLHDMDDVDVPCSGIGQWLKRKWNHWMSQLEEHRQHIFYLVVFYVMVFGAFLERFSFYMFLNETSDYRKVMGAGIAVTRGSAAALSVSYSLVLLAVCRNIITRLRETFVAKYVPLDSAIKFHKIAAWTGGFFSALHSVGHLINFYHVSTQPVDHLKCLFKELSFGSAPPAFADWVYKTLTGFTGVILFIVACVMYTFAQQIVRNQAYRYFWITHQFGYIIFYVVSILHGLPRLTGDPRFQWYFLGPLILYIIDRLIGIRQSMMELEVIESELLPSDVIHLKFVRPADFTYRSGQWIRLMCTAFNPQEAHPFTITSAPHENFLSVHVKAQGIWTWKLQNAFDPNTAENSRQPRLRIEGPFGGGNQDWYKYDVAVMVGAGMGVTPYASILKDLVFGTSTNRHSGIKCKKVYFLWITPSHKTFEWFIDTLHDIEKRDVTKVLEIHIFVTQFYHKFDLRTTMLYVCESHFQKLSNKSLFTGLKAINHFGRPDIPGFLRAVKQKHPNVEKVGVFSCGPKQMTKSVGHGCENVNEDRELPRFLHHYENF